MIQDPETTVNYQHHIFSQTSRHLESMMMLKESHQYMFVVSVGGIPDMTACVHTSLATGIVYHNTPQPKCKRTDPKPYAGSKAMERSGK